MIQSAGGLYVADEVNFNSNKKQSWIIFMKKFSFLFKRSKLALEEQVPSIGASKIMESRQI